MAKAGNPRFKLNRKAFPELMKIVQPDVQENADAVAASVRSRLPKDVEVGVMDIMNENGRPVSLVTIMHPSGMARQAKSGVLTRAAAERGLEVTRYPSES